MSTKTKLLTTAAIVSIATTPALAGNMSSEEYSAKPEGIENASMGTGNYAPGWNETLDAEFANIADDQIIDLVGKNVVTDGGDDVGEIDTFILDGDRLMAVVGVGGFLGMGEHSVALPMDELSYDNDQIVISYTAEELEVMPEYTEEMDEMALKDGDTFRTRLNQASGSTMASGSDEIMSEEAENAERMVEADGDTMVEDGENVTAEAQEATTEAAEEAEAIADGTAEEAGDALNAAGTELAEAGEATENAIEGAAAEIEQMAENASEETGEALNAAGTELAEAGEATENAIDGAAAETEQMAENAAEETGDALNAAENEIAEAAEATETTLEEGANEVAQATENATEEAGDWFSSLEAEFAEVADRTLDDLTGIEVATTTGEVVGEIDNFGRKNGEIVALVGVGGFLGLLENDVAVEMSRLDFDGERFIVSGYTEEELEEMPEWNSDEVKVLDGDMMLRDSVS